MNMDLSYDSQTPETEIQITVYENKIKILMEKIRDELQNRRELRAKIDEAKKREDTQIMVLERLDEYEKIVKKELELTENMQDSESVKQKIMIEQYENMLRRHQEVWSEYEAEYKALPLVKELLELETENLNIDILIKLANYRIQEAKCNSKMINQIRRRQEQLEVIEVAKLWLEHQKQEKRCSELLNNIKTLKNKERELQLEVEELERQLSEKEMSENVAKPSLTPQTLPKIDLHLSCFVTSTKKPNDHSDTLSINSYMLEQEYMNIDDQTNQSSQITSNKEHIDETLENDLILPEEESKLQQSNKVEQEQDFKRTNESFKRMNPVFQGNKKSSQENQLYNCSKPNIHNTEKQCIQSNQPQNTRNVEQVSENNTREYNHFHTYKKSSQDNKQMNFNPLESTFILNEQTCQTSQPMKTQNIERINEQNRRMHASSHGNKRSSQENQGNKRPNQENQGNLIFNPFASRTPDQENQEPMQVDECSAARKRGNQQQQSKDNVQVDHRASPRPVTERPVPSPSKMAKRISQDVQQQHSPRMNPDSTNLSKDLSRLPQGNKPQVKSCERVNYPNIRMQFQQIALQREAPPSTHHPKAPTTKETPIMMNTTRMMPSQTPTRDDFSMEFEQVSANVASLMQANKGNSAPSSMMSAGLIDPTTWGDTVSEILGSEITEPGGSFELAKRLYADSDVNSDYDDFDYEKMMGKICSPISAMEERQPQKTTNNSPIKPNNETQKSNSQEQNDRNFNFGAFAKKPMASQRFF